MESLKNGRNRRMPKLRGSIIESLKIGKIDLWKYVAWRWANFDLRIYPIPKPTRHRDKENKENDYQL